MTPSDMFYISCAREDVTVDWPSFTLSLHCCWTLLLSCPDVCVSLPAESRILVVSLLSTSLCCLFPSPLWVRFKKLSGCIWWEHSSSLPSLNIMVLPPPFFCPCSPSPRCTHQSCVNRVASHNSIQYQPWCSTLTNSQPLNVIGSTIETLLSSLCPSPFLLRLRGIWSLHSVVLNVKIPREIEFGFVSSGLVGLGVTIQYTESDKLVSIKGKAVKMKLLSWIFFCFNLIQRKHVHGVFAHHIFASFKHPSSYVLQVCIWC